MYLVIQIIKIHFSYILGFYPQFLVHSFPKSWNFLSDKAVFFFFFFLMREVIFRSSYGWGG